MKRRKLLAIFCVAAAANAWPLAAYAQKSAKPMIGFLSPRLSDDADGVIGAFRAGMLELGYIEGQNYTVEARFADGHYDRLSSFAKELVSLRANVIVAVGSPAVRAAQGATTTIPIVIGTTGDAVQSGLVASLAHPGGNTTGLSNLMSDITTKHVQLIMTLRPHLTKLAVLANPGSSSRAPILKRLEETAKSTGLTVMPVDAGTPEQVEQGLAVVKRERAEALIVVADAFIFSQLRWIAEFTNQNLLPSIFEYRDYPVAGGLISYGANNGENLRRAASFVDRILKGAKPADLPIEQPTKFELVINLKTAKAIGVEIPEKLLFTADEVLE